MRNLLKAAITMTAVLAIGSALPAMAQIENSVNFTTSFPFYAQNTKLPAGSYKIMPVSYANNDETLIIQSVDGKYGVFVDFVPTQSRQDHRQSDVTFNKYGNTEYLDQIWIEGQTYGMEVEPTKSEKVAAQSEKNAAVTSHGE